MSTAKTYEAPRDAAHAYQLAYAAYETAHPNYAWEADEAAHDAYTAYTAYEEIPTADDVADAITDHAGPYDILEGTLQISTQDAIAILGAIDDNSTASRRIRAALTDAIDRTIARNAGFTADAERNAPR